MKSQKIAATGAAVAILALSGGPMGTALAAPESPHEISANVALTSNYMFRGISQTNNGAAIQGGFDYEYTPYDLYAGVWASNVDSSSRGYNGAGMELDFYAGWAPSWKNLDLDFGYVRYQYPRTETSTNDTDEFYFGLSYDVGDYFTPGYTTYYSDDFFGGGSAWYHDLSLAIPLIEGVSLNGHYGWNRFDTSRNNYDDFSIGIATEYSGFGFDVSWVNRTKRGACSAPLQCGDTAVFTLSRSF
ncbi:MAG: TorF family putative porin [Candidatus Thiosymbion ectosymbiont of Robbea hypermnestra]|nr:TorF family putative porin [Candidatus Thiosymbion ectosymbiont of Robbea hypermnestra]